MRLAKTQVVAPPETAHARKLLQYWVCFAIIAVLTGILTFYSPIREAATILLFVPLIWGFMLLNMRGVIAVTILISLMRVGVEVGQMRVAEMPVDLQQALTEPIFPIFLYIALASAFLAYRRRQQRMMERLVRIRAREEVIEVADGLAHDFNNIMTAVTGLAEMLAENPSLDAQGRQDVQSILEGVRQGKAIIRRLRTFTNGDLFEFSPRNLNDVVAHQLPLIRRILPASVAIKTSYTDKPLTVAIDSDQFHRLLLNLCLNASTAMDGEGTIRIETHRENGHARLSIQDTGPGIDAKICKRIFEPEFSTRKRTGGSGMGLSVAQQIAKAHRGDITCRNQPGQGAAFDISLPCPAAE
jgi:signal transduction histidine kinase